MHDHHHRPRRPIRPSRRQRQMVYLATGLLLVSGFAWLIAHFLLPLPEFAARHPLEPWAMRIHGAATMLGLAVLGGIWGNHVLGAWERGNHRGSGGTMASLWLALALTGYGLYYLADEEWRAIASWAHIALGTALPAGLAVHVIRAGRLRRAAA